MKPKIKSQYEPHIDGLRAFAVLSVIVFHASPSALTGGFTGVDVFFVISGYLITKILYKEITLNTFTFESFYKRRLKRILPLYLLILSLTTVAVFFIYLPQDLELVIKSGLASLLFVSNMFFWSNSGYFSADSEIIPLLHTWSLAVEEQFYIFWPIVLIVLLKTIKLSKAKLSFIVIASIIICLFLSEALIIKNPSFGFYSLPSRAYELLIGALIALHAQHKFSRSVSELFVILGYSLLVFSFVYLEKGASFPGINALYPTVGTALIIVGGRNGSGCSIKLLKWKPIIFIGLLSYSLYLWHWPIFSILRYVRFELEGINLFVIVCVIFLLSYASYRYLEQPVIRSNINFKQAFISLFIVPLLAFIFLVSLVTKFDGFYGRYSLEHRQQLAGIYGHQKTSRRTCIGEHRELNLSDDCVIGLAQSSAYDFGDGSSVDFVLWGDSHANHFRPSFDLIAINKGVYGREFSFWGCPPLKGLYRKDVSFKKTCKEHNDRVFNYITEHKIGNVFIAARWLGYLRSGLMEEEPSGVSESKNIILDSLYFSLKTLIDKGLKVSIILSIPTYEFNPSICLLKNELFGRYFQRSCELPLSEYHAKNRAVTALFSELKAKLPDISIIHLEGFFCESGKCRGRKKNTSLYSDKTHLSVVGALLLSEYLEKRKLL